MKLLRRIERLVIGFLGPVLAMPLYVALLVAMVGDINIQVDPDVTMDGFFITFVSVVFSFGLAGIPSLVYTLLMEFAVNPKVENSALAVLISSVLGFLSGYMILGEFDLSYFGLGVGFIFGIILRVHFILSSKRCHTEQ